VFFTTSLSLAYVASHKPKTTGSVMQETVQSQPVSQPAPAAGEAPAVPADVGSKAKDIPK
jgi:preprotein translocase subunit SecG